jgi:holo-[acyl-carrier protein] synthase
VDESGRGDPEPAGDEREGVVAGVLRLVAIEEVERLLGPGEAEHPFSAAELAYARDRADPARRLAARLAAKRAAAAALGPGTEPADVEVLRERYGPPALRFSPRAALRLGELGVGRALVSLTHERTHAAAVVLLLRGER